MKQLHTGHCDIHYEVINKLKMSFGPQFDKLQFLTEQGGYVTGADLRVAKNGCELWEKRSWKSVCRCNGFDEQLCFMSENGIALSNVNYRLTLSNGGTSSGKTDASGRTQRIRSKQVVQIEKAVLFAPEGFGECCEKIVNTNQVSKTVEFKDIKTSEEGLGSSLKKVMLAASHARPLTEGEIKMASPIFKDSIDYSMPRVHDEEYLPFGFQPDDTAMTPNGEIYFNPSYYKDDFSSASDNDKIWFMHEMTHVWQYQLGYAVKWNAVKLQAHGNYSNVYKYDTQADAHKTLQNFNMEQQGDLVANYFAAKYLIDRRYQSDLAFFETVLAEFLRNPKNAALLPK